MSASFSQMKINSDELKWRNEHGKLTYNNAASIILSLDAIEMLMNTIEENVGEEKTNEILLTLGKRLGASISQSYSERTDLTNILIEFCDIYRNAGWGNVKITTFSQDEKRVVLEIHHSWEESVQESRGKKAKAQCMFLPSLWISLIQDLLNEELDYSISKKSVNGNEYDEIQMFKKA